MKRGKAKLSSSILIAALLVSMIMAPFGLSKPPLNEVNGFPAGWSNDINLSSNATSWDQDPAICSWNDNVHVIYRHHFEDFVYTKSTDGGSTSPPCSLP